MTKMTYAQARRQSMSLKSSPISVKDIFGKAISHLSNPSLVEGLESKGECDIMMYQKIFECNGLLTYFIVPRLVL
jgi:hypothetical protein